MQLIRKSWFAVIDKSLVLFVLNYQFEKNVCINCIHIIYEFIFLNIVRVKKSVPEKIHLHLEMRTPHITNTKMTRIQTRDPCTMVKNSSKQPNFPSNNPILSCLFPHIVSALKQFPPLNSFHSKNSVYQVKNSNLLQLFEFFTISKLKKKNRFHRNYIRKYSNSKTGQMAVLTSFAFSNAMI